MRYKKGFTLIELLVVISIISLLATMAMSALSNARSKARDTRRKSDFDQISKALDMYYDKYGGYPAMGSEANSGNFANSNVNADGGPNSWDKLSGPLISEGFMISVARDPVNEPTGAFPWTGFNQLYHYRSDGTYGDSDAQHYLLCGWLENDQDELTLGNKDMANPFDSSQMLRADLGYTENVYCISR